MPSVRFCININSISIASRQVTLVSAAAAAATVLRLKAWSQCSLWYGYKRLRFLNGESNLWPRLNCSCCWHVSNAGYDDNDIISLAVAATGSGAFRDGQFAI